MTETARNTRFSPRNSGLYVAALLAMVFMGGCGDDRDQVINVVRTCTVNGTVLRGEGCLQPGPGVCNYWDGTKRVTERLTAAECESKPGSNYSASPGMPTNHRLVVTLRTSDKETYELDVDPETKVRIGQRWPP
ncbi:MAG: hypothetical protein HY875_13600 [Chloroflexi bacterium]|nr:hypothetical protein [Chloroflexota bacterium]